jgi:sugar lactone lactonase YvrE
MSSEHHVRNEVRLRNVSNWQIYALQTEEERGEGPNCLPLDIDNCRNITFANLYLYRVMSTYSPFPHAVKILSSRDLRFRNVHVYSPSKFTFDTTIFDQTHKTETRQREIALLNVSGSSSPAAGETKIEELAAGFNNIDNLTVDAEGNVYFIDSRWGRIYRWSPQNHDLKVVRQFPFEPAGLALDNSGNLLVVFRNRTVVAFHPGSKDDEFSVLPPVPAVPRPGLTAILPVSRWRDAHDFLEVNYRAPTIQYLSPDGTTFIPAPEEFKTSPTGRGFNSTIDLTRAYALAPAFTNQPFYVADEFGQKTWSFMVNSDGSLSNPKLFAEEGEAGVAVDASGNVYVAAGNIFVYDPSGKQLDLIHVPERPTSLVFGGKDRRTLFIGARTALYEVRPSSLKSQ